METQADAIQPLVRLALGVSPMSLPADAMLAMKRSVLDTFGVALAGSAGLGCDVVAGLVQRWGGRPEGTLLVFGGRYPAPHAALANATMARAWDFDDSHEGGGSHVNASIIPAAFALAETLDRPISGKEMLAALVVGAEIGYRLRAALIPPRVWTSEMFAPFGVVAAAGRLLGFDEEQMLNGMGIAYGQCGCNNQPNVDGALTVRLQQGIGAQAGLLSVLLAAQGFTGSRHVLEGRYGLYPLFAKGAYRPEVLTDRLGEEFWISQVSVKPYPGCKFTHVPVRATLDLMQQHHILPDDIERIVVVTNSKAYQVCYETDRADGGSKAQPQTVVDAQFSIPYSVACAAVRGQVTLEEFTASAIRDPRVLELARKVSVEVDPSLDLLHEDISPNHVEIQTSRLGRFSVQLERSKGHPLEPMSFAECAEKFRRCARFAARPFPPEKVTEAIDLIGRMDELGDVRMLAEALVAP